MTILDDEPAPAAPPWAVTYGDLMSLLLTFFVMIVSMSELKPQSNQYQAMLESLQNKFGHDASLPGMAPGELKPRNAALVRAASMGRALRTRAFGGDSATIAVLENAAGNAVDEQRRTHADHAPRRTNRAATLRFEEHSAELTERHKIDLLAAVDTFGGPSRQLEIRSFASGQPPMEESAADLAYRRATNVSRRLTETLGIDPHRIVLVLAGPGEPRQTSAELRKEDTDSRVEVHIVDRAPTNAGRGADESGKESSEGSDGWR